MSIWLPSADCPFGFRVGRLEKGQSLQGHAHNFGHWTFFFQRCRLEATLPNGQEIVQEVPAGSMRWIATNVWHNITALEEPTTQYTYVCCYLHRDGLTGEPSPVYTGWPDAYDCPPIGEKPSVELAARVAALPDELRAAVAAAGLELTLPV